MTVIDLLAEAAGRLRAAGVTTPELDAELLFRHVSGWDRARVVAESRTAVSPDEESRFLALVRERSLRTPLQHITGRQWFWKHEFVVNGAVLIPRPETELIVEAALDVLRRVERPVIVDVGTGSGCIALSLAAERPDATVLGTDVSPDALRVASTNRERLGLEQVDFRDGDLLEPVQYLAGRIDLVASNPPYVREGDPLSPEVRDHEPALALFPPGDEFAVYRRLAPRASELLGPGGFLVLEVGRGMAEGVRRIVEKAGFEVVRVIEDLQGIPRTVIARKTLIPASR